MKLHAALASALLLALGACADAGTTATSEPGVEINLAALNLNDVTYTQYTITVKDSLGATVSTAQIDSNSYALGGDASTVRYVAPCDASDSGLAEITVSVDAIETGTGSAVPASGLPTSQTKNVDCVPNQSVQVDFTFQALASSELGFFDILLGTDVVYCSAKLDCETSTSTFFPTSADGGVVLGFACTAKNSATANQTVLHMDDIVLSCGAAGTATITPDQAGNLPAANIVDAGTPLIDSVTVFRGEDLIGTAADNVYWNVAIALTDAATAATCTLTTKGAVTPNQGVPNDAPYITWSVPVSTATGEVTCTEHPLFGTGSGVAVAWPSQGSAASFQNLYAGNPLAFVTSTTYTPGTAYNGSNAFFNDASQATSACGDRATNRGLGGGWVAWISDTAATSPITAKDGPSIEQLRLLDGTVVALGKADLLDGTLAAAIDVDEFGATVSGANVWTGTSANGTASGSDCNDWTDGTAGAVGTVGTQSATSTWTDNGTAACNTAARFICIQLP